MTINFIESFSPFKLKPKALHKKLIELPHNGKCKCKQMFCYTIIMLLIRCLCWRVFFSFHIKQFTRYLKIAWQYFYTVNSIQCIICMYSSWSIIIIPYQITSNHAWMAGQQRWCAKFRFGNCTARELRAKSKLIVLSMFSILFSYISIYDGLYYFIQIKALKAIISLILKSSAISWLFQLAASFFANMSIRLLISRTVN